MNTESEVYKKLAERLDTLPNGFPPTDDGAEIRLLSYLFTPEEAALSSELRIRLETAKQIAQRLDREFISTRQLLKNMARKGLIRAGKVDDGLGYGLLPFVVGIYENQIGSINEELSRLFEDYYRQAFSKVLNVQPAFHRVVPVGESINNNIQVAPFESAVGIIEQAQSWGVQNCICRVQAKYVGKQCNHPVEVCMVFSPAPDSFVNSPEIRSLTKEEAYALLRQADQAGLVHSVSNSARGTWYICNCCTCACGILRGMADLGIANVIASSAFINTVDETLCNTCGLCIEYCQFNALSLSDTVMVNDTRCVGCGVCVSACPDHALILVRRPEEQIKPVPTNLVDWGLQRANERGIDLTPIL